MKNSSHIYSGNLLNRNFANSNINKQTNFVMKNNNMFDSRKPQQLLMNNELVSNSGAEINRINQLSQSQNMLNKFQKSTQNNMMMNSVLLKNNYQKTQPITTQKYTAEIGEKRQLSNIIYNSILKRFKNVNQTHITEQHIKYIINQLGLNKDPSNWTKPEVKKFSLVVKKLINRKTKPTLETKRLNDDLFEKNTNNKVHYVAIDSRDRNRKIWPGSNEYRISFAPPSDSLFDEPDTGHISRDFSNVASVQLISAIIPRFSIDGDCIDLYPYILLEIEELGGIYDGTNASTNRAFCKITFDTVVGKYVHFSPKNYEPFIKHFNPRISMNRLTIRFKKPNGELFDFGTSIDYCHPECVAAHLKKKRKAEKENKPVRKRVKCKMTSRENNDEDEPNNSLTFKITTIEKSLDTMFLHPN